MKSNTKVYLIRVKHRFLNKYALDVKNVRAGYTRDEDKIGGLITNKKDLEFIKNYYKPRFWLKVEYDVYIKERE